MDTADSPPRTKATTPSTTPMPSGSQPTTGHTQRSPPPTHRAAKWTSPHLHLDRGQGSLEDAIDLLSTPGADSHAVGCLTLAKLLRHNSLPGFARTSAVRQGAIELLIDALSSHPDDQNVQNHGCFALFSLVDGTDESAELRRQTVAERGAVPLLVAALRGHLDHADVQKYGCAALSHLVRGSGAKAEQRKAEAHSLGAVPLVAAALRTHPNHTDVQKHGCSAICRIVDGSTAVAAEARRQAAADAGILPLLVAALRARPLAAAVQASGCLALGHLAHGDDAAAEARRQEAAEAGAIPLVVAAMRAHAHELDVQSRGCYALSSFLVGRGDAAAAAEARRQEVVNAGAIPLVVSALQVNSQDPYVQRNGCIALGRLAAGVEAEAEAGKQAAVQAGAIPLLLSAMRRLDSDAKMQTNGCWVLSRLVEGNGPTADARRQVAVDAGAMSLVSRALREHPHHPGIQGAVSRLLARLLGLPTDREAWPVTWEAVNEWRTQSEGWSTQLHYLDHLSPGCVRELLRAGADIHARPAQQPARPSPLELAQRRRRDGGAPPGSAAAVLLEAAEPWSVESHQLWPAAKRARAVELLHLGHELSQLSFFVGEEQAIRDLWRTAVIPAAMTRDLGEL